MEELHRDAADQVKFDLPVVVQLGHRIGLVEHAGAAEKRLGTFRFWNGKVPRAPAREERAGPGEY